MQVTDLSVAVLMQSSFFLQAAVSVLRASAEGLSVLALASVQALMATLSVICLAAAAGLAASFFSASAAMTAMARSVTMLSLLSPNPVFWAQTCLMAVR